MLCALTQPTDRAIAFTGLEERLATAFDTDARYGIIRKFLHRSLLWLRAADASLARTSPDQDETQKETVPSWSWMGYEGRIDFLRVDFERVAWSEAVRFPTGNELECRVREFRGCGMVREGDRFALFDDGRGGESDDQSGSGESGDQGSENGSAVMSGDESAEYGIPVERVKARGWLRFDVDAFDIETLKCVIIGRKLWGDKRYDKECYVIAVKSSGNELFERVGVGSVDRRHIFLGGPGLKARIV
jgi:hypothetical protein